MSVIKGGANDKMTVIGGRATPTEVAQVKDRRG